MTLVLPLQTRRVRRRRDPPALSDAPSSTTDRVPRVARMLALAHHWQALIRDGVVKDQAALAALVGVSRARVSQVMALLYLAPDIQEELLDLPATTVGRDPVQHRTLTRLAAEPFWHTQRRLWRGAGSA